MVNKDGRKPALKDEYKTPWYTHVVFAFLVIILVGLTFAATRDKGIRVLTGLESCEIILRDGEHGKFDMVYIASGDLSYEIRGKFILDPYFADRMEVLYNDKYLSTFLFDNIRMYIDNDSVAVGLIPIVEYTDLIKTIDIVTIAISMPNQGL